MCNGTPWIVTSSCENCACVFEVSATCGVFVVELFRGQMVDRNDGAMRATTLPDESCSTALRETVSVLREMCALVESFGDEREPPALRELLRTMDAQLVPLAPFGVRRCAEARVPSN